MPKVSEAHRVARRDQIIDAALRCFAVGGFQRTSIADIIAESGLSAGAIYGHFESKQQIAIAVAERVVTARVHEIGDRLARDPLPSPDEIIGLLMSGIRRDLPDSGLLLQVWAESATDPELGRLVERVFGELRLTLEPYLTRWSAEHRGTDAATSATWAAGTVRVFISLSQGYVIQSALDPHFDSDEYLAGIRLVFPA